MLQSRLSGESVNLFKAVKRLAAGSSLWEPLLRQQARSERRFYVQKLSALVLIAGCAACGPAVSTCFRAGSAGA